jgi:copper chaperone
MKTFEVTDMTCRHCASTIARAIAGVDQDARVEVQLAQQQVQIWSTAPPADLAAAIEQAGFTARLLPAAVAPAAPAASRGCGCGCGPRGAAQGVAAAAPGAAASACCS